MAQGSFKQKSKIKTSASPLIKKGRKSIAPKKKSKMTSFKLNKKLVGQSIIQTEQLLAPKAAATGKLTILKALVKK
jgi:hypothetical protein